MTTAVKPRRAGYRTLRPEQITEVRDMYGLNGGVLGLVSIRGLADHFHVSRTTIWHILHMRHDLRRYIGR